MSNDINTKLSNELDRILGKREDNEDLSSAVKVGMKEEQIDVSISNSDSKPDHETEDTKVEIEKVKTEEVETEEVETEKVEIEKVETEEVKTEKVETEKVKAEEIETEKVEDETKEKDINDKDEEFVRKKSRPKIPEYVEDEEIKNLNFDVELKKRLPLFEDILKGKVKEVIINNDEEEIKNLVNTISEIIDPLYGLVSDGKVEKNTVLVKDAEEIGNEIEDTKEETQTKTEKKDYIKIIKEIKNKKMIIISGLIGTSIGSLLSYIINL